MERGIEQARWTVVVLSDAYLVDAWATFQNALGQDIGISQGRFRVVSVRFGPLDEARLPSRLRFLTTPDLAHPQRADRQFTRLVDALRGPLPQI
jgi:hypothetical protein